MPADASRLIARLEALAKAAEFSPAVLPDIALETIADVQANAASLAGQQYQVGFDLDQFQRNIATPGRLRTTAPGVGSIGILDNDRMGTAEDFEMIAGKQDAWPLLYHGHTRDREGIWREVVYPHTVLRDEVAAARQAVWGDKTPQWLLLEEGFTGAGAFPATPPHHFVENATRATTILPRMMRAFERLFRGI